MAIFRINYLKTISQANTIKNLSNDLDKEIAYLQKVLVDLDKGWEGPASGEFKKKLVACISKMKETSRAMDSVANDITYIAKRINKADQAAAEKLEKMDPVSGGGYGGGGGFR